ncbi:MAG TPA: hypothetical protein VJ044_03950, partial [Candidatus Hodarchaeales archaeon]|nr:hypothetical protein [Candidatus Hodarchaeales archaeon]
YTFASGVTIGPGSFLVIAREAPGFRTLYGFDPDVSGLSLNLGNSGDWLSLKNAAGVEQDFVAWENSVVGWTINAPTGSSINRVYADVDTNSVSDWMVLSNNGSPKTGAVSSPLANQVAGSAVPSSQRKISIKET